MVMPMMRAQVGRDFLPRGPDICTRRPLLLQLVHTPAVRGEPEEWGEFLHQPGRTYTDFEEIREEIQAETDRTTGNNKGVSNKQIRLKICSPNVLTMTLVDLPGITRVAVGDQPEDIETQIRNMILSYIKKETCLILAVTPANSDLANSDALTLSKQVDPEGKRTLGVITKLDIMDRGTNAVKYLKGEVVPLRLGYVGVVNRCQADIAERRTIHHARKLEAEFFASKPEYKEVIKNCGVHSLSKNVSSLLADHIAALLPDLQVRIMRERSEAEKELELLGPDAPESESERAALVLAKLEKYAAGLQAAVEGRSAKLSIDVLEGGARIHYVLQEIFVKGLLELNPTASMTDEHIRTKIQNTAGTKAVLLVPEEPFEQLARQCIEKMLEPCKQCASLVHDELCSMALANLTKDVTSVYPRLGQALEQSCKEYLRQGLRPALDMIVNLVECQLAHINTSHPDFSGGPDALILAQKALKRRAGEEDEDEEAPDVPGKDKNKKKGADKENVGAKPTTMEKTGQWISGMLSPSKRHYSIENGTVKLQSPPKKLNAHQCETPEEFLQVMVTRTLLESYFSISRGILADMVPKAVMHFLVNSISRGLRQHLIGKLYQPGIMRNLLAEDPEIAAMRQQTRKRVEALNAAALTMSEFKSHLTVA